MACHFETNKVTFLKGIKSVFLTTCPRWNQRDILNSCDISIRYLGHLLKFKTEVCYCPGKLHPSYFSSLKVGALLWPTDLQGIPEERGGGRAQHLPGAGRRFYRSLFFTTDCRYTLRELTPSTISRCCEPPPLFRYAAASGAQSPGLMSYDQSWEPHTPIPPYPQAPSKRINVGVPTFGKWCHFCSSCTFLVCFPDETKGQRMTLLVSGNTILCSSLLCYHEWHMSWE